MRREEYGNVCDRTVQQYEQVPLRNIRTGKIGFTFGCTYVEETVQVRLENGDLDSWERNECSEVNIH
jgi:hypothetical protein